MFIYIGSWDTNEVIVYRVMMYANPLLIVQAMYFTSKGQSVYFWKYLNGGFVSNVTIKMHYSFVVYRITFS